MKKIALFLFLIVTNFSIGQIVTIKHLAYEINFDVQLKEPLYTHYILTVAHAKQCVGSKIKRTMFHSDSLLCATCQSSDKYYKGVSKIYDRGHLAPDDDFRWSKDSERNAMLFSNQSFQIFQFNRGVWKSLETYVRNVAKNYDVDVTTGVIFGTKKANGLLIPDFYWKIIKYNDQTEAWKIPNEIPKSKNYNDYKINSDELLKYLTK